MSKVIDALNKPLLKKDMQTPFQEEIAKTYLKVSDKDSGKKRLASKIPWLITLIAVFLSLAVVLTRSNIDVKVRILSEVPSIGPAEDAEGFESPKDKGVFLVKGSNLNEELVKDASFDGDAEKFSKVTDYCIFLCNSRGSGWANYAIELKEPLDLNRLDIRYLAKGERGDEYLSIVIVDADNRTYRVQRDMSAHLEKEWRVYTVNFRGMRNVIDLSNISAIKFEFGSLSVGNSPITTIYLKDILVTKAKRIRWL